MIKQLQITNLRNLAQAEMSPGAGFNVISGANGSGKSSLLEAVHVLGLGRSFRSANLDRLISHEQRGFTLFGRAHSAGRESAIGVGRERSGSTQVRINGASAERLSDLAQLLPLQLITPESFQLLTQGPKQRRQFLDWGVFHHDSSFLPAWTRYQRSLRQRNALLKQARHYKDLQFWDTELVNQGEILANLRENYLLSLRPVLEQLTGRFLPEYELSFAVTRGWSRQATLAEQLAAQFERECKLGYTSIGPHKADLRIRAGAVSAQEVLSRGQLKLLICALRIAQGQHYAEFTQRPCLFLIDDLPSELDSERRRLLLSALAQIDSQVFITAIEPDAVLDVLPDGTQAQLFEVDNGQVTARTDTE